VSTRVAPLRGLARLNQRAWAEPDVRRGAGARSAAPYRWVSRARAERRTRVEASGARNDEVAEVPRPTQVY
ncbi:MAG TPA: hypothetical protein VLQ67_13165, partial [Arachnia sp.]|nr:hypothetical protein [Arachnia sp.]